MNCWKDLSFSNRYSGAAQIRDFVLRERPSAEFVFVIIPYNSERATRSLQEI